MDEFTLFDQLAEVDLGDGLDDGGNGLGHLAGVAEDLGEHLLHFLLVEVGLAEGLEAVLLLVVEGLEDLVDALLVRELVEVRVPLHWVLYVILC